MRVTPGFLEVHELLRRPRHGPFGSIWCEIHRVTIYVVQGTGRPRREGRQRAEWGPWVGEAGQAGPTTHRGDGGAGLHRFGIETHATLTVVAGPPASASSSATPNDCEAVTCLQESVPVAPPCTDEPRPPWLRYSNKAWAFW